MVSYHFCLEDKGRVCENYFARSTYFDFDSFWYHSSAGNFKLHVNAKSCWFYIIKVLFVNRNSLLKERFLNDNAVRKSYKQIYVI